MSQRAMVAAITSGFAAALVVALYPPRIPRHTLENPRTIVDMTGRVVPVPQDPQRIAVLGLVLEVVETIDPCSKPIAGSFKRDILLAAMTPAGIACPSLADTPRISDWFTPNPERIMLADPDVVFGIGNLAANLETIGYPSLERVSSDGRNSDAIWSMVGAILGEEARADALLHASHDRIADLRTVTGNGEARPLRAVEMFGARGSWQSQEAIAI